MSSTEPKPTTITGKIYALIFELLDKEPAGIHWAELNRKVLAADQSFHPKTVNGCVWKLVEKFPEEVYKPEKGLFRLTKYKETD